MTRRGLTRRDLARLQLFSRDRNQRLRQEVAMAVGPPPEKSLDEPVRLKPLLIQSEEDRLLSDEPELADLKVPAMTSEDFDEMRLSVLLMAKQLDKVTVKMQHLAEVLKLVERIMDREKAVLQDAKKLAKLCGVDLE